MVDVGYVGSLGRHLSWLRSLQDIPLGTRFLPANADPTNTRVPLPDVFLCPIVGYNGVSFNENNSSSNYHSLQVTANRRFARNLEFGLAWTWSKSWIITMAISAPSTPWRRCESGTMACQASTGPTW